MPKIAILVTERCQASNIHTILDILIAANHVAKAYLGAKASPFQFELIGLEEKVSAYNRTSIDNIRLISKVNQPDIVIIPGAFEASVTVEDAIYCLDKHREVLDVLNGWYEKGTLLASACTGNFLLAKTGILNGREITCHWAFESFAYKLFPNEAFCTNKILIDHGDMISAGGATAIGQLVLYTIAREHSKELAQITAKMMLIELNFEQQSRFAMFRPSHKHKDAIVLKLQKQLEESYAETFDLGRFAVQNALSEKQIVRRFKSITGETPLSYLQKYRIEKVKIELESGSKSISNVIWDVGYEDVSSFRRLFKKTTGLTLQEYRSRFSACNI
ncbi:MAG: helix-turn-helix domain-containing protein [Hahellaceae bacterium]|nr:helix-turn-helix domain-containing protein [Hahellaceae bacterium]